MFCFLAMVKVFFGEFKWPLVENLHKVNQSWHSPEPFCMWDRHLWDSINIKSGGGFLTLDSPVSRLAFRRSYAPLALVALVAPAWACIINEDDVLGPAEGCHDEWPCCPRVSSGPHLILSHCPARRTIIFHAFKKGRRRWRGDNGHK